MKDKIRIGFVGCGQFCAAFVPLFKAHPMVEYVAVCDKFRDRAEKFHEKFGTNRIFESLDEMLASDEINSVAIFTQRNQHGEMVIKALEAGKNVYSAVPMAFEIEEIARIIELVREKRLTYSMGETGIYRPASIFCRQKHAKGEFGEMVYAEAQYNHDIKKLRGVFEYTEKENWRKMAGFPPLFYPTHSTSMVLSAARAHAVKVAAFGYEDKTHTDIYGKGSNWWDNPFSNTAMLLQLSNGAVARISENRRVAWAVPETYISHFYGSQGSYECSLMQHSFIRMPETKTTYEDVSDLLNPTELTAHRGEENFMEKCVQGSWSGGNAPIQLVGRLPEELIVMPTGHAGTHKFMVDDFCQAYATGKLSPTNPWAAARYMIPGLIAHQSAMQGGVTLDIPDFGDPPSDWEVLSEDREINEVNYHE